MFRVNSGCEREGSGEQGAEESRVVWSERLRTKVLDRRRGLVPGW